MLRGRSDTRDGRRVDGYELDGAFVPFDYHTEVFQVRGAAPVRQTVRFTRDGPVLNDLEPFVARRIPLTAVRAVPPGRGADLDGARAMNRARTLAEFGVGLSMMDVGCQNWLAADAQGHIGYRSPCVVPVREGWRGTFPVPGWTRRYDWRGLYDKGVLPTSTDPARGWLVTANSDIVPSDRFPTRAAQGNLAVARRKIQFSIGGETMDRFWLKHYPPGVPADVNVDQYSSLVQLMEEGFAKYANRDAYAFMDRRFTFAEVERQSKWSTRGTGRPDGRFRSRFTRAKSRASSS